MSKIAALYQAIIDHIESEIPALREVRPYREEFDDKDVRKVSVSLPGCLVAVTVPHVEKRADGRLKCHVNVAVAVVTREVDKRVPDFQALLISEAIATSIHHQRFNSTATSDPTDITIENVNSEKTRKMGVSIWSVAWQQAVTLHDLPETVIPELTFIDPPADTTINVLETDSEIGKC